jgi:HAMP domain-containing protein
VVAKAVSVERLKIPKEAALLPFEEKAKYVIELRRRGKTYREIQKMSPRDVARALKVEAHRDEIQELKTAVGRVEDRLNRLNASVKDILSILETAYQAHVKYCIWLGYSKPGECPISNPSKVKCALCYLYVPKWLPGLVAKGIEGSKSSTP